MTEWRCHGAKSCERCGFPDEHDVRDGQEDTSDDEPIVMPAREIRQREQDTNHEAPSPRQSSGSKGHQYAMAMPHPRSYGGKSPRYCGDGTKFARFENDIMQFGRGGPVLSSLRHFCWMQVIYERLPSRRLPYIYFILMLIVL